jgi:hypothetical protein
MRLPATLKSIPSGPVGWLPGRTANQEQRRTAPGPSSSIKWIEQSNVSATNTRKPSSETAIPLQKANPSAMRRTSPEARRQNTSPHGLRRGGTRRGCEIKIPRVVETKVVTSADRFPVEFDNLGPDRMIIIEPENSTTHIGDPDFSRGIAMKPRRNSAGLRGRFAIHSPQENGSRPGRERQTKADPVCL